MQDKIFRNRQQSEEVVVIYWFYQTECLYVSN